MNIELRINYDDDSPAHIVNVRNGKGIAVRGGDPLVKLAGLMGFHALVRPTFLELRDGLITVTELLKDDADLTQVTGWLPQFIAQGSAGIFGYPHRVSSIFIELVDD